MSNFLVLSVIISLSLFQGLNASESGIHLGEFEKFLTKFDKRYDQNEFRKRLEIFSNNLIKIMKHNKEALSGNKSYTLGVGPFADLTVEEFSYSYLNPYFTKGLEGCDMFTYQDSMANVPKSMDWREKNAVTDVKDQGQCGSCWAFSTTGAVEGLVAINNGNLDTLSEQQLVDCSRSYGNNGCYGGLMTNAFEYVRDNKGLCSEGDYSYQAKGSVCKDCTPLDNTGLTGCSEINSGDQNSLIKSLSVQPISVGIQADSFDFQHYSQGVFNSTACYTGQINHGVLLVAYDQDTMTIKNSWGSTWGDNGYITMARTDDNVGMCGVYLMASFPQ